MRQIKESWGLIMTFSERKGLVPVAEVLRDKTSPELRAAIWNIMRRSLWDSEFLRPNTTLKLLDEPYSKGWAITKFTDSFWSEFLKLPIDQRPPVIDRAFDHLKHNFFDCEWFRFYDLLEFLSSYYEDENLDAQINLALTQEMSAYRLVDGLVTDVTSPEEIAMLDAALANDDFPNVTAHLRRSLELFSDRRSADYRNSIKESISAVESLAKEISRKPKATLGDALKVLESNGKIHPALKEGFLKLYGYASDSNGIRHAMMEESDLSAEDAKFFLMACTSFINYLKAKL